MNERTSFYDTRIGDYGPIQNETLGGTDKDLRTVRVAPFWEQNQSSLLIAAPDEASASADTGEDAGSAVHTAAGRRFLGPDLEYPARV